jgi:hypothetical protein
MPVLKFLVNLVIFSVPAAVAGIASARLAASSDEEWKLLAWVPISPLVLWAVFIAWGVTRDPTSHNLWPFELVVWTLLTLALFAGFLMGRRLTRASSTDWRARQNRDRGA